MKALSLFRRFSNYTYSHVAFRNREQPKLYNDAFNMFMLSAFVKESAMNINNQKSKREETHDKHHENDTESKIICEITTREKNKNNKDCCCKDTCIVRKSEILIICDKCI
jgi:hypothetical protein